MPNFRIFSASIWVGLLAFPTLAAPPNLLAPAKDNKVQTENPQETQVKHVQFTASTKPAETECKKSQRLIALLRQQEKEKQQREDYQRFEARVLLAKHAAKEDFVQYLRQAIQQLPIDTTHEIEMSVPLHIFRGDLNLWNGENGWRYFKNAWFGKIAVRDRYQNHPLLPAFKAIAEVLNHAQEKLAPENIKLKIIDKNGNEKNGDDRKNEPDYYLSIIVPALAGFEATKPKDMPPVNAQENP